MPRPGAASSIGVYNMQIRVGILTVVVMVGLARAGWADWREEILGRVLPAAYAEYVASMRGDHGMGDVRACLQLAARARGRLVDSVGAEVGGELEGAHSAAWELCLRAMHKTQDPAAVRLVIREWDRGLSMDDAAVASQIRGMWGEWDRRLATASFWGVLERTKNLHTVHAICHVLYEHGTREDAERLYQIGRPERDAKRHLLIVNASSWLKYRLAGGGYPPPPTPEP